MKKEFPHTVSYNRFVERQAQVGLHLLLFLQTCALGKCTMGWFYGFKLHLVINDRGEIIQWQLTPGTAEGQALHGTLWQTGDISARVSLRASIWSRKSRRT